MAREEWRGLAKIASDEALPVEVMRVRHASGRGSLETFDTTKQIAPFGLKQIIAWLRSAGAVCKPEFTSIRSERT